jgi:hypothetical protein
MGYGPSDGRLGAGVLGISPRVLQVSDRQLLRRAAAGGILRGTAPCSLVRQNFSARTFTWPPALVDQRAGSTSCPNFGDLAAGCTPGRGVPASPSGQGASSIQASERRTRAETLLPCNAVDGAKLVLNFGGRHQPTCGHFVLICANTLRTVRSMRRMLRLESVCY